MTVWARCTDQEKPCAAAAVDPDVLLLGVLAGPGGEENVGRILGGKRLVNGLQGRKVRLQITHIIPRRAGAPREREHLPAVARKFLHQG